MKKNFQNNCLEKNLYKKMSLKSEITTQMIYGDVFSVIKKYKKWLKIRLKYDNYIGFIKDSDYSKYRKPNLKVSVLSAKIYSEPRFDKKIGNISFGSKIKSEITTLNFVKFDNKWIEKKNTKKLGFKHNDIFSKITMFKGIRYKWGGISSKGIDCSALIQIFYRFNNKFLPRDTVDQEKFLKKNVDIKKIKKNDIIYWKGHVAVALSNKKLIHAYGPMKKVVVMDIKKCIKKIKETASLQIINIKRI